MPMEVDSGLEQGYSRESSGNDNTGPPLNRRPMPMPASEQPDVVQTSVPVTVDSKSSETTNELLETKGEESDYVEYPRRSREGIRFT